MRILSWNVNGIRACAKRGFAGFLERCGADVIGVQEVRALPEQIPDEAREPAGWHAAFSPAERLGYSGVGLYARRSPSGSRPRSPSPASTWKGGTSPPTSGRGAAASRS